MTFIPASPDHVEPHQPGSSAEAASTQPADTKTAGLFAPADGTFNAPTAAALTRWKEE